MKKRFLLIVVAVLATVMNVSAQQMPNVPLDPAVKIGVLPNGLSYYIRHNEWPEKRADFYIAQKVGSIQEEENQRGLAHFLEHMCFNGTTHFPGDGLKQYLERIGVKFGENLNAYTSFDETVYNINNVNVEIAGAVDSCLLILHDWSHDLLLEDKEIDKERGVINEEWRVRRSAMMRMQEAAFKDLYVGSRYADRMPIGTMDIVMNFPYEDLRAYYRRWYRPDLQGLVIVGDVNPAEIEQKIKDMFADIAPAPADAAKREVIPVPDNDEPLVSIQKDKEQTVAYALLMFKHNATPRELKSTMAYIFQDFLQDAVSSMFAERLQEMSQKPDCPFIQAGVDFGEYLVAKSKESVNASIVMKEGQYLQGVAAVYREVLRAKRGGFTEAEYERFKQEYLSRLDAQYEARDKVQNTRYVNEYVRYFLDNEPAPGIEWAHQNMKTIVPMLPLEAINQAFPTLITEKNRAIALFMPEKEGMQYPTKEEILKTLADVDAEEIAVFKEEVNTDPLVPELKSKAKVKSIADDVYGAKLITLSNGIKIHVLQTDYSPNQISMSATSWGGSSLYPNDEYYCSGNAGMVSLGGWGTFTATQLSKKLSGIQASVSPNVSDRSEGLSGSCVKKDFETLLQLTYLCFTAPHRDDEAFQSMMARLQDALKNQDLNPRTALQDSMASVLYNNNIRAKRLRTEDIAKISYDRVLEIYKERFANAADFEFYFVGDLNLDSVALLSAKYLGALPISKKMEKYNVIDRKLTKGERTCIFDKEQDTPNATVNFVYHAPLQENMRNDILVDMLEQSMSMLYTETVREDEGGAYGVPVSASLTDYPEEIAVVQIQLPTAPEKMERMSKVVYDGVEKLCNEGPSEDYLQKIKEYMVRSHAENLKKNSYWMNQLVSKTRLEKDYVTGYDEMVQSITVSDIKELAQKIFKSGNRLVVGMKSPEK
ncbi:MAG: insulinase family protein [Bacteroidaceae bacterium]|nr:insulinase family protein [Bacteroidaceae bacterium]